MKNTTLSLANATTTSRDDSPLQLVLFGLGDDEYAIDILNVQEINRVTEITCVPQAPDYLEGVMNLRGRIVPVINMRRRFGLDSKSPDKHTRIVVVDSEQTVVGLIVDSVTEILRVAGDNIETPPPMVADSNRDYIKAVIRHDDDLLVLLDLPRLIDFKTLEALSK
jgi:purine-binding chemotaxis protein CheW